MMLGMRLAMIARKNVLPYDYAVEYLFNGINHQNNVTSVSFPYIDTGYAQADDVGIEVGYSAYGLTSTADTAICGSWIRPGTGYCGAYMYAFYEYKMWGGATKLRRIENNEFVMARSNFLNDRMYKSFGIDGAIKVSSALTGSPSWSSGNIWLGCTNKGDYYKYPVGPLRIYSFKMSKGQSIVLDMIPVVDRDGVACMYDTVSNTLKYSASQYQFTAGPRI